ncbi:MAG: enoyl-CoA hydratase-related protein [Acidimicrobiales bacterium]
MAELTYEKHDGVGLITINRPDRRNALSDTVIEGLTTIFTESRRDDSVRALVLTGAGTAFCAGGDVKREGGGEETWPPSPDRMPSPAAIRVRLADHMHRVPLALAELDKPVIAAVNGAAVGAGMDLALMCDMRIAARSARFSEAYLRVGLIPGDGGCFFLPRLVGIAKALELLLTCEFVDADEALRIGLVNRVVDDESLLDETLALAQKLASMPPVHVQLTKRAAYQSLRLDLATSLELTASHMAIARSLDDSREAIAAFLEKRTGVYTGR